jgi:hypothetical protein
MDSEFGILDWKTQDTEGILRALSWMFCLFTFVPLPKIGTSCVENLEFRIWDLGFGIWDLGFGIWDLGLKLLLNKC